LVSKYRRRLNKGTDLDPEATKKMERASMHDVSQPSAGYFNKREHSLQASGLSEIMGNSEADVKPQTGLIDSTESFRNFLTMQEKFK